MGSDSVKKGDKMKLNQKELRVAGIAGIVFAFLSGMMVEYTSKVIIATPELPVARMIVSAITVIALGAVVFSELS